MAAIQTVAPTDTLAVLKAAEKWLSDPRRWTQRASGRNGGNLRVTDPAKAEKTCATGALALVVGNRLEDCPEGARQALQRALGASVVWINDGPDGYPRIMAGLRRAIETIESEPRP